MKTTAKMKNKITAKSNKEDKEDKENKDAENLKFFFPSFAFSTSSL
jgi:hypothetical protein